MEDENETLSGRVRSYEALVEELQAAQEVIENQRRALQIKDQQLLIKDQRLFLDDVVGLGTYENVMTRLRELKFPEGLYTTSDVDNEPAPSSVPFSVAGNEICMSKFRYETLNEPKKCPWKRIVIAPESVKNFVVEKLFGGNEATYLNVVARFSSDLKLIRNALYFHHQQFPKKLKENEHFRPLFVLWLQRLTQAVPAGEADDNTGVQIDVRDRELPMLKFTAIMNKKGGSPETAVIKGFEDVVITRGNAIITVGEFKVPFSALSQTASLSLQNQAFSQSYAEMQGFMATDVHAHLLGTASTETAAAAVASSTDNVITDTSSSHRWCVSFLTDGFVLYLSFGTPHNRGEASYQLPPVYTSGDSTILGEEYFTQQLLYAVASVSTGPDVDVSLATADFYELTNCSEEKNASDHDEQPRPSSGSRDIPSHFTKDATQEEDCIYCEQAIGNDPTCLTWDDNYEEFLAEEREAVLRLKALLAPSFLSQYSLQKLGTRRPVF